MKRYKAVVIDGRKLIRRMGILGIAAVLLLLVVRTGWSGTNLKAQFNPQKIIRETVPVLEGKAGGVGTLIQEPCRKALAFFLQFDLWEPATVLAAEVPLTRAVNSTGVARLVWEKGEVETEEKISAKPEKQGETSPELTEIPPERQAPIKEVDAKQKPAENSRIALGNETSYPVEPEELLQTPPSITMDGKGPKVLVVHTHGTEAYAPEGATVYDTQGNDRSEDTQQNVVKAGEVLCRVLEKKGIETIHDTRLHDTPSFNGSYASSLKSTEEYLAKYPSIQVILDVHRDSIVYEDGTKAKVVTEINGKKAAQLMFVVGTDQKGLENPNWRENIKSAVHFQNAICQKYPTLMRHINLRRERFNGHTSKASMIIETGSSGNSLSEALYGITLAGECLGDYLNSL